MNHKSMQQFKRKFLDIWTSFLTFINKVCLLVSFLLIPYLLGNIVYSLLSGLCVRPLLYSLILVSIIYSNKEL